MPKEKIKIDKITYNNDEKATKMFMDHILNILIQNSLKEGDSISERPV